jgi:DNA polymerase-3 subunit alpha
MSAIPASENFVHLHVHTEYSMLDGAARIGDLYKRAAEMGMPAIATTDHGYLFGAYDFWKKSKDTGVKPIIGVEAYVTPGTHRTDKTRTLWGDERTVRSDDVSAGGAYTHMTMLATDNASMANLFTMSSLASLDQVYAKWPRIDRELLHRYGKGMIATTGCPSGEIQTRLRLGQYDLAREAAAEFRDIFGAENYFLELMDHGNSIERRTREDLMRLAKDLSLPLLATNDLHYVDPQDDKSQDGTALHATPATRCIDPNRFKFDAARATTSSRPRADASSLWRELPAGLRQHLGSSRSGARSTFVEEDRQIHAALPLPGGRGRDRPGSSRRSSAACTARFPEPAARVRPHPGRPSRPTSSSARATPATSWSSPTSSPGPRTTASGSARVVARVRGRCVRTR